MWKWFNGTKPGFRDHTNHCLLYLQLVCEIKIQLPAYHSNSGLPLQILVLFLASGSLGGGGGVIREQAKIKLGLLYSDIMQNHS